MKNLFAVTLFAFALSGCSEGDPGAGSGTSQTPATTPSVSAPAAMTVSYTAGDSATLEVPKMMCPFMCYPNVKDTLEEIPGIASVELVAQKEEGKIDDRRVTVTFDGDVDPAEAVAALERESFAGSTFE